MLNFFLSSILLCIYFLKNKIQKQYKIKKSKNILLTTCLLYKSIFCTFLEMSFNNDTDMYRCLSGSSLKCFSKTRRFSKISSQWLSYNSVRNPDFNDDFWLFSNQGLVRSKTKSFTKSSGLNKQKRLQTKTRFQNSNLEHFFKIHQKIFQNLSNECSR